MKLSKTAAAGALMVAASASAQNLLLNGGFETGPSQSDCSWNRYYGGSTAIAGWTIASGNIDRVRLTESCAANTEAWRSFAGEYTIDLRGDVDGKMCQAVPLEPGRRYRISIAVAGNCGPGLETPFEISIDGNTFSHTHICTAIPQVWTVERFEFIATTAKSQLCLTSHSPYAWGGAVVDEVSLIEIACPADVVPNGVVDGSDLAAVLGTWGTDGGIYPRADTNADGVVDGNDLAVVLGGWGACP